MTALTPLSPQEALHVYVSAFVDELGRSGVKNVVICPGSRSTPLAMVFAEHQDQFKLWMHVDERSAAFFALGMAKASHQPVAILCTSGTAAANFLPAVVEAHYSGIPLVVLTADRPPELRDVGAAQTIDQVHLYGTHAKWYQEMALPEATPELLRYVRTTACRAVAEARRIPRGPVHLNFPFREPLVPIRAKDSKWYEGRESATPYVSEERNFSRPSGFAIDGISDILKVTERGLIIVGPAVHSSFNHKLIDLAKALGYPILADALSNARFDRVDELIIDSYDAFLHGSAFTDYAQPEVIIRIGGIPTSKPLVQYLQKYPNAEHILVDDSWSDPNFLVKEIISVEPYYFYRVLSELLRDHRPLMETKWAQLWIGANQKARATITERIQQFTQPFEGRVFTELADLFPDSSTHSKLFLGSSMPVRDCDTFFPATDKPIQILSNRGTNGIDGVVSSALGASTVPYSSTVLAPQLNDGPTVLVIGDLSFYHDMNGLLAAKMHQLNATIIVINNDGGGIFSFLPQAAYPEHFEQLYGTPTGLDFSHVAALYGATFHRMQTWSDFREAVTKSFDAPGLKIIEVPTDRQKNVEMHREIWKAVSEALKPLIEGRHEKA